MLPEKLPRWLLREADRPDKKIGFIDHAPTDLRQIGRAKPNLIVTPIGA